MPCILRIYRLQDLTSLRSSKHPHECPFCFSKMTKACGCLPSVHPGGQARTANTKEYGQKRLLERVSGENFFVCKKCHPHCGFAIVLTRSGGVSRWKRPQLITETSTRGLYCQAISSCRARYSSCTAGLVSSFEFWIIS